MASMLANTKSNVHFHIISNRLSDENKAKLSLLSERFPNMLLNFHEFTFDSKGFEVENSHLTVETYYRLYFPEILPDLEHLLYLDGDTVINGDISELWNIDLGKHTVGVVVDSYNQCLIERNKAINFNDEDLYFNAGVMLINLKRFKECLFIQQISIVIPELYKRLKKINGGWYADQELLNYRFNADKSALFLPLQYNFMDKIIENYETQLPFYSGCYELKDWALAYSNPVIIHYSSGTKPFPLDGKVKYSYHWRLYYKYKAFTPFYDPLDEKRIAEYNRNEQLVKTDAFILINFLRDAFIVMDFLRNASISMNFYVRLYIQLFWQDIFLNSAKHVKQIIGNRKLAYWGAGQHITHIMAIFASDGLYPDAVVDGLASNHGKTVFEYTVQPAKMLRGKFDEYFVVLCMETKQARDAVIKLLKEYGYDENGFVHAYAEAYEREDKPLL
jgi:lipopolysaccharide biosynthesis glycosyltransferase